MTLTNMCTELGAQTGLIAPDVTTMAWLAAAGVDGTILQKPFSASALARYVEDSLGASEVGMVREGTSGKSVSAPRPDDLYRFAIPFDARLSPDGRHVTFTVQRVGPSYDGYRLSIWTAPVDGSEPARRLTLGARCVGRALRVHEVDVASESRQHHDEKEG